MTHDEAAALAARCLPCPFCAGQLAASQDPSTGEWRVNHARPGLHCYASATAIHGEGDLLRWNARPIESQLREEVARLREALEPIAVVARDWDSRKHGLEYPDETRLSIVGVHTLSLGHCRTAARALEEDHGP